MRSFDIFHQHERRKEEDRKIAKRRKNLNLAYSIGPTNGKPNKQTKNKEKNKKNK